MHRAGIASPGAIAAASNDAIVALGSALFRDTQLSRDGSVSCASCHDPSHAYADAHARAIGVEGKAGTRNAPSLIGVAQDDAFFWDGRRARLEDAVLDPFTNPVELGWSSLDEPLQRLRNERGMTARFAAAFPRAGAWPTTSQLQAALAAFVRSLPSGSSAFDRAQVSGAPLPAQAEHGRYLFSGIAGCSECHAMDGAHPRFTDGKYHHSGVQAQAMGATLPALSQAIAGASSDPAFLGPKILSDPAWSAAGRFVVTHAPADVGAFRTPSLRNVALTAPYMHDSSIATLAAAVDHEIYYRSFSTGHAIDLSQAERQAIVAFLECLTDAR